MKKNPVITGMTVSTRDSIGRTERDLILRHQAALREIERWDMARELRPHTPRLAAEAAAVNWESEKIVDLAGPLTGPRTGTHPMAERVDRPMATRIRPPLAKARSLPGYRKELLYGAANMAIIAAAMLLAAWVATS